MSFLSFTNLRVLIDASVHEIYKDLTKGSVEDAPFIQMPDLFITAACVGAKENKFVELGKQKKDIFVADAFDRKTQIPILITLAFKYTQDLDDLADAKKILNVGQAWANGGINIVYDHLIAGKGLRPLFKFADFVLEETKK